MQHEMLQIPNDPNLELYYDSNLLSVGFRAKKAKHRDINTKVLRVVIQAYGKVLEDQIFKPGSIITVGTHKNCTFHLEMLGLPNNHKLIDYKKDRMIDLSIPKTVHGVIQTPEKMQQISSASGTSSGTLKTFHLKEDSSACFELGNFLIFIECITQPEKIPVVPLLVKFRDPQFTKWLGASLFTHGLLILLLALMPKPKPKASIEDLSDRFKHIVINPITITKTPPMIIRASGGKMGQEGEGARAAGPEGDRGKGRPEKSSNNPTKTRDIKGAGVLDFFNKGNSRNVLAELTGGGGIGSNLDNMGKEDAKFGNQGARDIREGKGLQGSGKGGGGDSASIGSGLGTQGKGGGKSGTGLADFGTGKSNVNVSANIDDEEVYIMGSIPKSEIARIINNHMGQIEYCYQKEVQRLPNLRGKITVDFIIGLTGRVTSANVKKSSINNATVEQCVLRVVRSMPFPSPGGGIVKVTYPFAFSVAG